MLKVAFHLRVLGNLRKMDALHPCHHPNAKPTALVASTPTDARLFILDDPT